MSDFDKFLQAFRSKSNVQCEHYSIPSRNDNDSNDHDDDNVAWLDFSPSSSSVSQPTDQAANKFSHNNANDSNQSRQKNKSNSLYLKRQHPTVLYKHRARKKDLSEDDDDDNAESFHDAYEKRGRKPYLSRNMREIGPYKRCISKKKIVLRNYKLRVIELEHFIESRGFMVPSTTLALRTQDVQEHEVLSALNSSFDPALVHSHAYISQRDAFVGSSNGDLQKRIDQLENEIYSMQHNNTSENINQLRQECNAWKQHYENAMISLQNSKTELAVIRQTIAHIQENGKLLHQHHTLKDDEKSKTRIDDNNAMFVTKNVAHDTNDKAEYNDEVCVSNINDETIAATDLRSRFNDKIPTAAFTNANYRLIFMKEKSCSGGETKDSILLYRSEMHPVRRSCEYTKFPWIPCSLYIGLPVLHCSPFVCFKEHIPENQIDVSPNDILQKLHEVINFVGVTSQPNFFSRLYCVGQVCLDTPTSSVPLRLSNLQIISFTTLWISQRTLAKELVCSMNFGSSYDNESNQNSVKTLLSQYESAFNARYVSNFD